MLGNFKTKSIQQSPEQKAAALRTRLDELRSEEVAIERRLATAKAQCRELIAKLDSTESAFAAGEADVVVLNRARNAAAEALTALKPIEIEIEEHRGICNRCGKLLDAAEVEAEAAANVELMDQHADWRRRFSEALTEVGMLADEGLGIEIEIAQRCPTAASELIKLIPGTGGSFYRCTVPRNFSLKQGVTATWLRALHAIFPEDLGPKARAAVDSILHEEEKALQRRGLQANEARARTAAQIQQAASEEWMTLPRA